MLRALVAAGLFSVLAPGLALADDVSTKGAPEGFTPRRIVFKDKAGSPPPVLRAALTGATIYLNRCVGGCQLAPGTDDMTANPILSGIPNGPTSIAQATDVTEEEWAGVVQCVKEVYSPYAVNVVEEEPTSLAQYSGIIVGGNNSAKAAAALGLPPGVGGIVSGFPCQVDAKGVGFAFADDDNVNAFAFEVSGTVTTESRILGLCWIVAQESAHTFGLSDHEFEYVDDKSSACNDPMTYRFECGGQKFFRNRFAACGEFKEQGIQQCKCGSSQNSHLKLLTVFGEGVSLIPRPTASITTPAASSSAASSLGNTVNAIAGSKRGVNRLELYINGYKWAQVGGAPFGRAGQLNPSNYQLVVPADVPDSVVDLQVKAYDDVELVGESAVVTVVKGAAGGCQSADTCAAGQRCEAGKCFWDPPVGEIGEDCTFPQFCLSGLCSNSVFQGDGICTQSCVVGLADACPTGLTCVEAGSSAVCIVVEDTGCCSTSNQGTPWAPFMLGGIVLGFVALRRKRR